MERLHKPLTKYGGIAAVVFELTALASYWAIYPQYFNGNYAISYYATLPVTRYIFMVLYLVAAIVYWQHLRNYVAKRLAVPVRVFGGSMICFGAVAIFPYHPESILNNLTHITLVIASLGLFIVGIGLVGSYNSRTYRRGSSLFALLAGVGFMSMFGIVVVDRPGILFLEAGTWLLCQIWIVWLTVMLIKAEKHGQAAQG